MCTCECTEFGSAYARPTAFFTIVAAAGEQLRDMEVCALSRRLPIDRSTADGVVCFDARRLDSPFGDDRCARRSSTAAHGLTARATERTIDEVLMVVASVRCVCVCVRECDK